ncbi:histidine kinase [Deinococcus sp. RL]|uniref:PAS domain-containing sensor histidine kinase n=1 Tax=Deinococcus sp. RL TaxID=1489678 RepID=UPI0004D7CA00|nr:PAS domain-containing sensor histidine kinase [Deinococcus sp. RL]KEF34950.1 histidine kinase [Deinococcus sp. RL]
MPCADEAPATRVSAGGALALLAALPDPVLRLRGQHLVWLNPAARERLGEAGGGEVGLGDWQALFPPDTAALLAEAAAQVAGGAAELRRSVGLPGSLAPALATLTPDGEGGVWLHLRDTRHPLEVAEELLDGLGLGLLVQGADGRVLQANAAGQRLLDLSLAQMTGEVPAQADWHVVSVTGERLAPEALPTRAALQTGEAQRDVLLGVVPGGPAGEEPRWLSVTALPRPIPGTRQVKQVVTVFADVTPEQRLRRELERSERRYRSLVEATTQIVWTTTPAGELLGPQPGWTAFTGQTPQEYSGAGWVTALHPDDRAGARAAWQRAVEGGTPYETEYRLRRADGVYVPMLARGVAVREESGQVREWVGINQDLSAVKAAEARLRELNARLEERVEERTRELAELTRFSTLLLTSAGEGIFGLDRQGRTTFANPAAAQLLGYSVERLIGAHQHSLIHHHRADGTSFPVEECPIYQTLRDGQPRRSEEDVFWHAAGHPVPVAYVVTPTHDAAGEVSGAVVMFQDIGERQRARAELEAAVRDLKRSNAELEQFAYVASHDLQEPLRTLGSYAELLARRYQGQLDDRADQYLRFMVEAVERMRGLIQDLLGFARVGRAGGTGTAPIPVPLDGALRQAQSNVRALLEATGGDLDWETPQTVLGHPGLLVQLLTNLVGNGLKFHRPGVAPQVRVTAAEEGGEVVIRVADNGIGIAPEYHERVFAIFQRLNPRETYPGNGMGLAICRKIAEAHGGRLTLTSTPGEGTTFELRLPLWRESA